MDKKDFEEKTEIDRKGYRIWKDSGRLVHRWVALKEIYSKDRKKYPLKFSEYQVHHKDGDKLNNRPENLELVERGNHEKKHGVIRRERLEIRAGKVLGIGMVFIFLVDWLMNKLSIEGNKKIPIFLSTFLFFLVLAIIVSLEDKKKKYI